MALYLEDIEIEYLTKTLDRQPDWWVRNSIIKKINSQAKEYEKRGLCDHTYSQYEGKKICCSKCGGLDIGMGEEWYFKKHLTKKQIDKIVNSLGRGLNLPVT